MTLPLLLSANEYPEPAEIDTTEDKPEGIEVCPDLPSPHALTVPSDLSVMK
jgi:hypothetical protein